MTRPSSPTREFQGIHVMFSWFVVCVLFSFGRNDAAPTRTETMTKMSAMDLEGSSSGYVYNQQQGLPVYYVQYTNHGSGRYYHAPESVRYVVDPVVPVAHAASAAPASFLRPYESAEDVPQTGKQVHQETANYGRQRSPHRLDVPVKEPRAPYYVSEKTPEEAKEAFRLRFHEEDGIHNGVEVEQDDENDSEDEEEDQVDEYNEDSNDEEIYDDNDRSVGTNFGGGYGAKSVGGSSSSEASGSRKHSGEEYSQRGEKGRESYEKNKEVSKGEHGAHDSENQKGYYSSKGERDKGHVDEAENHGSHEEAEKAEDGSDYGHFSYNKKGHKTNGFHNVYRKDEYKKETDFYDDDHKKGHFDKYENFHEGYEAVQGGFKKGGHRSSENEHQDRGKKGYFNKGHQRYQDQGHEAEKGERSYHANHANYSAEEGSKSAKVQKSRKDSGR
ncbi:uncharacterized protein DDB_G0283697-like [Hylaeus anthracinus]|uniref:uncharacterized protein DDB_G0283697-like n=1 Tax=Hylaeus anthracinus TaxID=313031 RepID=UPI0023B8BC07|nr:uncharacterized protein DDB_G0283697-like [Hylaeus anthracinus]